MSSPVTRIVSKSILVASKLTATKLNPSKPSESNTKQMRVYPTVSKLIKTPGFSLELSDGSQRGLSSIIRM